MIWVPRVPSLLYQYPLIVPTYGTAQSLCKNGTVCSTIDTDKTLALGLIERVRVRVRVRVSVIVRVKFRVRFRS